MIVPGQADAAWRKATSDNFIIYSDGSERELRTFVRQLELYRTILTEVGGGAARKTETRDMPLTIFLVEPSKGSDLYGENGMRVGGWYSASERGAYDVTKREASDYVTRYEVLFHEYAHHFMLRYFTAPYPRWFIEGYAELNSTIEFRDNGDIVFGNVPRGRAMSLLMGGGTMDLEDMMDISGRRGDASQFYATAWLLTHYLTQSGQRKGELPRYLAALSEGKTPAEAAATFTGGVKGLQKDLNRYLRNGTIPNFTIQGAKLPTIKMEVTELTGAQADLVMLEAIFLIGPRKHLKTKFLRDARAVAGRYPGDADAQAMVADALAFADDDAGAVKQADATLARWPDNVRALLRKGESLMNLADKADDKPEGKDAAQVQWKAARAAIVKANKLASETPRPLVLFYDSFARQGLPANASAHDGLEVAYDLLPVDTGTRIRLVHSLAERKMFEEAAFVLNPLANSPHSTDDRMKKAQLYFRCKAKDEDAADCGDEPQLYVDSEEEEEGKKGEGDDKGKGDGKAKGDGKKATN